MSWLGLVLLNKKGFGLNNLRQALLDSGLTVAKRQGFEARLNEAANLNANRLKLVENAKTEYQKVLKQKYNQIKELKEKNSYLYEYIDNIPKLIRKIFIKEEIKKY